MQFNKRVIYFLITVAMMILASGCSALSGKWAYNHDPQTPILELKNGGQAIYKEKKYTYRINDPFIELTASDGSVSELRYRRDGDDLYIYEQAVYNYEGEGDVSRLPGRWVSENNMSFEFTVSGKFCEDGLFTGIYKIDPDEKTFTLVYNEDFQDTTCYYSISGNQLRVEYPWCLVKVK